MSEETEQATEPLNIFCVEVTTIQGRSYVTEWSVDPISASELEATKGALGNILANFESLSLTETTPNYFFPTAQIEAITVRTKEVPNA